MVKVLGNRVLVSRIEEPVQEGFQAVEVQDSFLYKGKVEDLANGLEQDGDKPIITKGNTVLFSKYSPDTHEVDVDGQKMKIISVNDILAIYE